MSRGFREGPASLEECHSHTAKAYVGLPANPEGPVVTLARLARDWLRFGTMRNRRRPPRVEAPIERIFVDTPGERIVRTIWLTIDLEEAPGWTVAYRLIPITGRPVVVEVRLFPTETKRLHGVTAGEWSAEVLGSEARVPEGGVPWEAVRALAPSKHVSDTWEPIVRRMRQAFGDELFTDQGFEEGFERAPRRRPGRAGWPDAYYAEWSDRYVGIAKASRRPILELWREEQSTGRPTSYEFVRDTIDECRRRGLLTRPGSGRSGGDLTPKCRQILVREERKRRAQRRKGDE